MDCSHSSKLLQGWSEFPCQGVTGYCKPQLKPTVRANFPGVTRVKRAGYKCIKLKPKPKSAFMESETGLLPVSIPVLKRKNNTNS